MSDQKTEMTVPADSKGVSRPALLAAAMAGNRSGGGGGKRRDIHAEVISVDAEAGRMLVKDKDGEMVVEVSDYTVDRMAKAKSGAKPRADASHEGWMIDSRMADIAQPGTKVILESMIDYGHRGEDQKSPYPVGWIRLAPVNDMKVREALVSSDGRKGSVFHVYEWADRGLESHESYGRLLDRKIVEAAEAAKLAEADKKHPPVKATLGFVVRAAADGVVFAHTPIMHWNKDEKRTISGEELNQIVSYYKDSYPDANVDVIPVQVHRPSGNMQSSPQSTFPRSKILNAIRSVNELGQPLPPYGQGMAVVHGLISLSPGKIDPRTGERKGAENDWVNAVFASGKIAHAMEAIPTHSGETLKMHPDLEPVYPGDPGHAQNESHTQQPASPAVAGADEDNPFAHLDDPDEVAPR